MRLTRTQIFTAVTLSLGVHVAAATIFISRDETIRIAGGAATAELVIGTAFDDSLMAGETGEVLKPVDAPQAAQAVETPAVEAETVEPATVAPATTDVIEQAEETAVQPAPPDRLPPVEDMPDQTASIEATPDQAAASPVIEALATRSEELASLPPASETEPVAEPQPQFALPDTVPVPVARPKPPAARTASSQASDPQKATAAPAKPRKSPTAEREKRRASAKPSSAGDGGRQSATTSRASSGSATAKRSTAAGNAEASNYPGKIASKLRRALRYPREAKRQGIRGDVVVSFVVAGIGGVGNIRIAKSSGFPVLDEAAKDAVRRAAPFPPIPPGAGRASWPFSVPLGFTR